MIAQKARSKSASLPAPIGGWNARDVLSEMDPTDAVNMENMFPLTTSVRLRKGYTEHATGLVSQVETLMAYSGPSTEELKAIAGGSIYDVTSAGAVGAAEVSGLTNSRFQYINVSTSGGNFLLSVNGANKLQGYDGSSWYVDGDGSHDITAVDTADCIGINLFKNRVWLVEKESLSVWYLPTNAIAGAATEFPFNSIASKGGYLVAMGTWTIDAGYGVDDLAVFITSQGEVIVYRGTDPSSATTWALVGVWQLGAPIGRRCFLKYQGDLLLVCQDGVLPLSGALQSSRVNPRVALTDKIQSAMNSAAVIYGGNYGWQLLFYPKANMLFLNVPVQAGNIQQQYVMNTITKSWCKFTGWEANCWEIFEDEPYFGGEGFVGQAWDGLSDNDNNIDGIGEQAFNYFGSRGVLKRWTMLRPILLSNGSPATSITLNIDFAETGTASSLSFSPTSYASWDSATWDSSVWGSNLAVQKSWQGAAGIGYCASVVLQVASKGIETEWISTDAVYEKGAIL